MNLGSIAHKKATTLYSEWTAPPPYGKARPSQLAPAGDWSVWLILAGRGWGKTLTGAADALIYALQGPDRQVAVVTPTFGDLRRVAFGGPSGIMSLLPPECLLRGRGQGYNASAAEIRLHNGSKIMGFSATEPDRLRGPQFHRAWCDELAAWQYEDTFDQLMFGLRLGDNPKCVITTTPKPTKLIKRLMDRSHTAITRGNTFENAENLAPSAIEQLKEKYGNTRLGRQELYAEVLTEMEGALWKPAMIEAGRTEEMPEMQRIVVAVDPAVTAHEGSDETGIIVAGRGVDDKYYVIDDLSGRMSADNWASAAIDAYSKYKADRIIAEVNNGGDLVERLIRTVDKTVPYTAVRASRGKMVRAEPVSALYEQEKVCHVGVWPQLEDQMCSYTVDSRESPDRLDALVWALTDLSRSSGQAVWRVS